MNRNPRLSILPAALHGCTGFLQVGTLLAIFPILVSSCGGGEFPVLYSPMATKSHKKKKPSASHPSINPKPTSSDKKPKPPKPTEDQPEPAAADKKPKKRKARDEIDEIFSAAKAGKKRKPAQREEAEAEGGKRKKPKEKVEGGSSKKKSTKTPGSKGKGRVPDDDDDEEFEEKRPRRRTADGLAIYSADELGFGKADAGGTPLCPFDCDCCF